MMAQEAIEFTQYLRCYCVGRERVRVMLYDPRGPFEKRYVRDREASDGALVGRIEAHSRNLCRALGYDLNTLEYAVRDGVPYAIDFMNPAPDCDLFSVGQANFDWILDAVARSPHRPRPRPEAARGHGELAASGAAPRPGVIACAGRA